MNSAVTDEMVRGMDDMADLPRARATDPATSHSAAAMVCHIANSHKIRILEAIKSVSDRTLGATAGEIAAASGLSVVQVDRRLIELQRENRAYVVKYSGGDLVRGGYRVWKAS
jgi:hypothetical protein